MALMGAWNLRAVSDADWLDRIGTILLFAAAGYFGLVRLPQTAMDHPPSFGVLAIMGIAFIGFYDGFFGSGTGSLSASLMISMLGLGLRDATVHVKLFWHDKFGRFFDVSNQ